MELNGEDAGRGEEFVARPVEYIFDDEPLVHGDERAEARPVPCSHEGCDCGDVVGGSETD